MNEFDFAFRDDEKMIFNVVSKAVIPLSNTKQILYHQKIGKEAYKEFIPMRRSSNWSPMKIFKIKSFTENKKKLTKKISWRESDTTWGMKKKLIRFLITARVI